MSLDAEGTATAETTMTSSTFLGAHPLCENSENLEVIDAELSLSTSLTPRVEIRAPLGDQQGTVRHDVHGVLEQHQKRKRSWLG